MLGHPSFRPWRADPSCRACPRRDWGSACCLDIRWLAVTGLRGTAPSGTLVLGTARIGAGSLRRQWGFGGRATGRTRWRAGDRSAARRAWVAQRSNGRLAAPGGTHGVPAGGNQGQLERPASHPEEIALIGTPGVPGRRDHAGRGDHAGALDRAPTRDRSAAEPPGDYPERALGRVGERPGAVAPRDVVGQDRPEVDVLLATLRDEQLASEERGERGDGFECPR